MLSVWSRAICALAATGCYTPSPVERLPCSETDRCPSGQQCDLAFHQCAASPICIAPDIVDRFDGSAPPCLPWGQQFGNAVIEIRDQAMAITPAAGFQNSGGCVANAPIEFAEGGIFLEVLAVMPPGHGFLAITVQGGATQPSIAAHDGVLSLDVPGETIASVHHDAAAMRWWRLRPDRRAGGTVAEYAADGLHWTRLGLLDVPPEPQITLELSAGGVDADPAPTTARVAHLGVCPVP